MTDPRYFSLGQIASAEVGVLHTLPGQDILIQDGNVGRRLTRLLDPEATSTVRCGNATFWRIPHSREVDALLVELIDLFISIRYAHPALVQLELALPVPSSAGGNDSDGISLGSTGP